jgi:hypothetical protein
MRTRAWLPGVLVAFGFALFNAGGLFAQTTTSDVRNFEVLAVDGNKLVVRDQRGTHEYTVPDDFRFTVDGKPMSVKQLKPGMKGTATVTKTTTVTPVTDTEFRDATEVEASEMSLVVRGADGVRRRFTKTDLDKRGIQIYKEGRAIRIGELKPADQITGSIVTSQPPVVVTETEVDMKLAQGKAEPAPAKAESAAPAAAPAPATTAEPAKAESAAPAAAPSAAPAAAPEKAASPQQSQSWLTWIVILIVIAVVAYLFMRKKRS